MVSELFVLCVYTVVKIMGSEVHVINPQLQLLPGEKQNHKSDNIAYIFSPSISYMRRHQLFCVIFFLLRCTKSYLKNLSNTEEKM